MKIYFLTLMCALLVSPVLANEDRGVKYGLATSKDAQRIAYSVYGHGDFALVFVHGWSCDSRYWQFQVSPFETQYKVITIDLAGHGNSSSSRDAYTIGAFAEDVHSVLNKEKVTDAILVGHSMGGAVVAATATLMPDRFKGIIGIDTLHNVGEIIPQEALDTMANPFASNFDQAMRKFVAEALLENTDANLKDWITEDMSSAPKSVAINAFVHYLSGYVTGESSAVFKDLNIPVVSINSRLWPTNLAENNKHIENYRLVYIDNTGHFPMLERPEAFNSLLAEVIDDLLTAANQ